MDFGDAVREMKAGGRVARSGWNGKGMYLFLAHGSRALDTIFTTDPHVVLTNAPEDLRIDRVVCMRTAQGTIQPGWSPSQADMLREDWMVYIAE